MCLKGVWWSSPDFFLVIFIQNCVILGKYIYTNGYICFDIMILCNNKRVGCPFLNNVQNIVIKSYPLIHCMYRYSK